MFCCLLVTKKADEDKDGTQAQNDSSSDILRIFSVSRSHDNRLFTCMAVNNVGVATLDVALVVNCESSVYLVDVTILVYLNQ